VPKAVEAFRNIGEVSAHLGVKKHVLRFWEAKFPQLKPMKRGGGRRLYRPGDVELLQGIRDLLQTNGYTIKGVQKIIREHGIDHVKAAAVNAARPQAPPCAVGPAEAQGNRLLSDQETKALRAVLNELGDCHALLAHPAGGKADRSRAGRLTARRTPLG
jgi:DNA-binding transcriptional MerR regulator